ncbi:hypothetical protein SAMN02745121_01808 [Nannocystis exedens]|uniref:Uncharacterized protein n=1 Tax=Nannocystis exedens TaxID=54 RepID=A0A1I1VV53_9BACT|nr:hypothetical protein [Nannocystis exedens]PCC72692.1 hypothetical protein NAEX_05776 [Nannocystis exedens]SFD84470.1 hypothetical protein SAMN02745121_01808 [Nannocystis exedens]
MPLLDLKTVPEPVVQTAELIGRLDEVFESGFGRLSSANLQTLASLAASFAGTPLAEPLDAAIAGLGRSEFVDRHFAVIAAARAAAHGAMHDALVAQACAALSRPRPELEALADTPGQAAPPRAAVLLESVRQWLMELAIAGFANLEVGALLPFQATLDAIMAEPALVRHAALLSGFLDELLTVFPAHGKPEVPRLRWVDLWTRSMVLSLAPPAPPATREVKGELRVFATDLRQHDHVVSLVAFGALHEPGKPPRVVRTGVSAFKVDVLQGDDIAGLLADVGGKLLEAIAGGQGVKISGMLLHATGDLVWQEARAEVLPTKLKLAEEAAAVLTSPTALRPGARPEDRHPAVVEELVWLPADGYSVAAKEARELSLGGQAFPLAVERWPSSDDLLPSDLAGSKGLVALLRFDGGRWSLQPVMIDKGKPLPRMVGTGLQAARGKAKGGNLATLKERAGKLLRKKS